MRDFKNVRLIRRRPLDLLETFLRQRSVKLTALALVILLSALAGLTARHWWPWVVTGVCS